jgi:hypothetical protein
VLSRLTRPPVIRRPLRLLASMSWKTDLYGLTQISPSGIHLHSCIWVSLVYHALCWVLRTQSEPKWVCFHPHGAHSLVGH